MSAVGSESPDAVETIDVARHDDKARSGAQSGAMIAAASVVAIAANYAFLLAAGRILGSEDYGALAALLGLLNAILLPTGALQHAVAREIAQRLAVGDRAGAQAFAWATLRLGLIATTPVVALALVLVVPVRELLKINSTAAVLLTALGMVVALAFPIGLGALQGYQRFQAIAALYLAPSVLRLLLFLMVAAVGFRLGGAVYATVAAGIAATAAALALLYEPLRRGARAARPALDGFLHYLGPVVLGLIGIAVLTNVDLLVVKARFSPEVAGDYAAASAFARVAFFLPATILAVLFPRTAARQARGEDTADILGRSLLVTAAFSGLLTLFYAATARGLVHTSFGAEFAEAGELVVPFTVAMAFYAVANVLVGFHLSRGETRYAWIAAGAVVVQLLVLVLAPGGVRGLIWANVAVGAALLAAHELFVGSSISALRAGAGRLLERVRVERRTLIEASAVFLGATALVCVLFWPIVAGLGSTVIGQGSDATGTVWALWQLRHESGYHLFGSAYHTLTGAPFGWVGGNGLNIQWLLPYYPAYLASHVVGEVAAHNLVLLTGYMLSGASMYLLVRYLGCNRAVAAWAGLVFVVFPAHLARTPHASLVHLEFLPLILLALLAAARRPSWGRFLLVGAATLACWLTSGYFGTMAVIAAGAFTVAAALPAVGRRAAIVVAGSVGSALGATFLIAALSAVSGVGRGSGLHRFASDLTVYGVRPLELVLPAADNVVLGDSLRSFHEARLHGSNLTETSNYLGLLTIALALAWLVVAWRRRATLDPRLRLASAGLAGVVLAALLLALPSPVAGIPMPSRFLWEVVPPFRVPSRWIALVMAALVPLAALALQEGWARLARRRSRSSGVPVLAYTLVAAAMLVSFLELAISPAESRFRADRIPAEYAALSRTPPGVLAEYPLIENVDHLFWQRIHGRPVLNSSAFGSPADDARRVLLNPGSPGTAEQLAFLGVTAIVTHEDALSYRDFVPHVPNASWGPGYELVARVPNGASTWRVAAAPAPALATLPSGFGEPKPPEGRGLEFALTSSSGVAYVELRAKKPGVVRLTFDAEPPKGQVRVLRIADAEREREVALDGRTSVSVLVELPQGLSRLLLKTDPPATSEDDAIDIAAPYTEATTGAAELRAESLSPDVGF